MRLRKTIHCLAVTLLCLTLPYEMANGQSSTLLDAFNRYNTLYQQGKYSEALPYATEALRLGKDELGPDHPTTAILLNNLAELYRVQGNYIAAEPLYRRSLAIGIKALGPEHPDVARSLNNLAVLYHQMALPT